MEETRRQIKERLQAAGRWGDYLALREQLAQGGLTPAQARAEALRQIESRPPHQSGQPAPDPPSAATPIPEKKFPPPPPLCERCRRILGQPACPTCFRIHRTVENLRAAGFRAEAKWLEGWIERHANGQPAAKQELCRLPHRMEIDAWLVYNGKEPKTPGQARLKQWLETDPTTFITEALMGRREEEPTVSLEELERSLTEIALSYAPAQEPRQDG